MPKQTVLSYSSDVKSSEEHESLIKKLHSSFNKLEIEKKNDKYVFNVLTNHTKDLICLMPDYTKPTIEVKLNSYEMECSSIINNVVRDTLVSATCNNNSNNNSNNISKNNSNNDLITEFDFATMKFEKKLSQTEMLRIISKVPNVQKILYCHNTESYMFSSGNTLFELFSDKIRESHTPLFNIISGFNSIDSNNGINSVAFFLNKYYEIWKKNNYTGELFTNLNKADYVL